MSRTSTVLKYLFSDAKIRVQNVCHSHKAFPDVKTNVYHPEIASPDLKMCLKNIYNCHKAFQDVKTLVQNPLPISHLLSGHQNGYLQSSNSFLGCQNACTERQTSTQSFCGSVYHPVIAFPDLKMRVQNVSHRHNAFPDVKMLVQNVYQPHTSFPDIKTRVKNVYFPLIAFSEVKTRVQNVYHPHTAFLDVKTSRIMK